MKLIVEASAGCTCDECGNPYPFFVEMGPDQPPSFMPPVFCGECVGKAMAMVFELGAMVAAEAKATLEERK